MPSIGKEMQLIDSLELPPFIKRGKRNHGSITNMGLIGGMNTIDVGKRRSDGGYLDPRIIGTLDFGISRNCSVGNGLCVNMSRNTIDIGRSSHFRGKSTLDLSKLPSINVSDVS